MRHFNVTFEPDGRQISIHAGATLADAAGQAGIILNSVCGGKGICKKCAVILQPSGCEVLACQHRIQSNLTVTIPTASRLFEQKILERGIDIQPKIALERPSITAPAFGLAVDIGTTTVVAKLIDMADGRCIATQADINPQTKYGDDVISRIDYAQNDEKLTELHKVIIDCINELTARLCKKASIDPRQIYEMCVVGNTTMNHIFLKLPVTQLGRAPYSAFSLDAHDLPAERLSLQINPAANVHTVENIAGFVGSDTTAVALAVDINSAEQTTLVIDIGTNGELVLAADDKLYAASCAAGPAFEGARITHGSRAAEGAIEAVVVNNGDIDLDVIGDCPPRSICGSGLIDAVAVMLDLGVIDKTGRFADPDTLKNSVSKVIASRLCRVDNQPAFLLAGQVVLTQLDIRQTQLAKAAIRTGILLLQKKLRLEDNDIKQVLLAGAFGNYIRRESALRIGLLPTIQAERIHFVGNAASSGAQMLLVSQKCRKLAKNLARKIQYIEIANEPGFTDTFADCMSF
jgi:uncharacterized 2Fe-2S/4Fe-4S cluster protein (DUF4445 family)